MTPIQAFVLGIIQGITEFLPISSSGHLVLVPTLLGWKVQPTSFDIALHTATLFAIIIYFQKDLIDILRSIGKKGTQGLLCNIGITSIPAGLIGYFFDEFINANFKSIQCIIIMLVSIGILMIIIDKKAGKNSKSIETLPPHNAFLIGLLQIVSLIRGTSRSGITIIGGILTGLNRTEAARYSFLASIPLMTAVSLKQLIEFRSSGLEVISAQNLCIGFVSALGSGMFAIKFLLRFLQKKGLAIFGIYRMILGMIIFLMFIVL